MNDERMTKPGFVAYATSKAALSGTVRNMVVELGAQVRCNAVCPRPAKSAICSAWILAHDNGACCVAFPGHQVVSIFKFVGVW